MKDKTACRWTVSPCWLRSLRDFIIPLAATWAIVAVFFLFLWIEAHVRSLDILLIFILTLITILLTAGLLVVWRRCLYLGADFVKWLNVQQGHVIRSEKQKIDARLGKLYIKAIFDRPSRDYKRLAGLRTEVKIKQLLAEFPGIAYVDIPHNASHPNQYFLDYCARFMLRTSLIDLYWLADLKPLAGATMRLHVEQAGKIATKVLTANAELEAAVNAAKQSLTIPDSLLEVTLGPSWLRVRVVGGSWLGKQFSDRIREGIAFAEALTEQLRSRYNPLSLDAWTLNDQLEAVPIGR